MQGEPTMFCLLSDQGTAAAECALCPDCYADTDNRKYAQHMASQSDDVNPEQDFAQCKNGALTCCICDYPNTSTDDSRV